MAAVVLLPIASRGVFTSANLPIAGGAPKALEFVVTGTQFPTDPTLTFQFIITRSPDGIQPFVGYYDSGADSNTGGQQGLPIGKFGAIYDGIPRLHVSWDGIGAVFQIQCVPNKVFTYGLTGEVLP